MIESLLPHDWWYGFQWLGCLVSLAWGLWLLNHLALDNGINRWGIQPRTWQGLLGILCAPFLHGDMAHLLGNTSLFLVLGSLVWLTGGQTFWIVLGVVTLSSGLGIWLMGGDNTNHIGASGVVFGFLGFLILRGYFQQDLISAGLSTLVGIFYGSRLLGVLPLGERISWEAHLFGFVGGAIAARFVDAIKQWVSSAI